jgi:hypothetical protein
MDGKARLVTVTPTISTSAYADGDQLGDVLTLTNAMDDIRDTGAVLSVSVIDKAKQNAAFDILFFDQNPTVSSSDNAALNIADAEMAAKFLGRIKVATGDYSELSASSVASVNGIGLFIASSGSKNLFAILQSRGTPTYTSTSDLVIKIGIVQD